MNYFTALRVHLTLDLLTGRGEGLGVFKRYFFSNFELLEVDQRVQKNNKSVPL